MVINQSADTAGQALVPSAPGHGAAEAAWHAVAAAFARLSTPRFFERVSPPDPEGASRAHGPQLLPQIRAAWRGRDVFLELGRVLTDADAGLLGPLVMAQPSGSAAFEQFQRYQELVGGPIWTLEHDGPQVRVGYRASSVTHDAESAAELALSAAYHLALRFWGPTVGPLLGVELGFPEPSHAADYRRYFAGPLRFGASRCSLVVPRDLFELVRPGVDRGLAQQLVSFAFAQWASRGGMRSWVARVESALAPAKHLQEYQLERVAHSLHVSERTLRRRLAEEGTTFSAVASRMRDERAARLLLETDLPLSEIATTLGYSDPTSFRRACRTRFGRTPRQIRRAGFVHTQSAAQALRVDPREAQPA